ncbi:hypothetical protein AAHA92_15520 [Salvia divinorum]|uniref:Uncharacterized protein n=1 Tax=Salvia divinorum TaxID=28513 RepID=A0ABD1HFI6_SALDI
MLSDYFFTPIDSSSISFHHVSNQILTREGRLDGIDGGNVEGVQTRVHVRVRRRQLAVREEQVSARVYGWRRGQLQTDQRVSDEGME